MTALLLLLACGTDPRVEPEDVGRPRRDGTPDMVVTPDAIELGAIEVGVDAPPSATVTVTNEGDAPLGLESVTLEDPDAPFTLSILDAALVEPGASAAFTVTFTPVTDGVSSTRVLIYSDDPDEPVVALDVSADGWAPVVAVSPTELTFDTAFAGCEGTAPIRIQNDGRADLVVDDVTFATSGDDLSLDLHEDRHGALPWTLPAGEGLTVHVTYAPLDDLADEGVLTVHSNDPQRPEVLADLVGQAGYTASNLDTFEQATQNRTDFVFTLDWTAYEAVWEFDDHYALFASTLVAMGVDYRISVANDDDGCVGTTPPYVDASIALADQAALFDEMVNNGTYGAYGESGFTVLRAATSAQDTRPGGCNEGMLRDDATLALIGVTDEPEQSVESWDTFVATFQALKDDPGDVVIHAIGGDVPYGCGSEEASLGWYEATIATGGAFLSVCVDDWSTHFVTIAEASSGMRFKFALTGTPIPETLEVRLDGVATDTGWGWDEAENVAIFDPAPAPGVSIEIAYGVGGECGG